MQVNHKVVRKHFFRLVSVLACALFVATPSATAQMNYLEKIGPPQAGAVVPVEMGEINLTNGNLHLEVPLGSFPQRGSLGFAAKLVYDSRIWVPYAAAPAFLPSFRPLNVLGRTSTIGGWRLVESTLGNDYSFNSDNEQCDPNLYPVIVGWATAFGFNWQEPGGSIHFFDPNMLTAWTTGAPGQPNCTPYGDIPNTAGYAVDGSGLYMVVTNHMQITVYDKNGTQVSPIFVDSNGNYFSSDGNGNVVDTLGRVPVVTTASGNNTYYDVLNAQGTRSRYTMTKTTINVSVPNYTSTMDVVQSITLPNGTLYTLGYDAGASGDHWGLVNYLKLPTGAEITYGYQTFADAFQNINFGQGKNRWVTSRTSGGGTWQYAPLVTSATTPFLQQTTVTRPNGDYTVYKSRGNCDGSDFTNTERDYYQADATLLKTELIDYFDDCGQVVPNPVPPIGAGTARIQRFTTVLYGSGGSLTSKTEYDYTGSPSGADPTKISEWNFYTGGAPATPDRARQVSYSLNNSTLSSAHITAKPLSVTVTDGAGNQIAQTAFAYDNYTGNPLAQTATCQATSGSQPSPAAPQHDYHAFCATNVVRGNLTQTSQWLNSSGAAIVTSTNTFDDTGNVVKSADALAHATQFTYSPSFGRAYQTQIQNALGHITTKNYDVNTGLLLSQQDPNGQLTGLSTTYSYDNMGRLIGTTLPDGGNTTVDFHGDAVPLVVSTTQTATPDPSTVTTATLDGLGRAVTNCVSDPEGDDCVDTTYDANGRVSSVSNPHRATAAASDGITSFSYDALDRQVLTTRPDNNVFSNVFSIQTAPVSGQVVIATDETLRRRRSVTDGFGRLLEVDEPNPGSAATAATGSVNIGGNEQTTNTTVTITVANSGFEIPGLGAGNFQYSPVGGSWTFSGGSGLSANGSGFTSGNPAAPQGAQLAFLQGGSTSVISQSLSGFQSGVSYTVSFLAAQRANASQGGQDFDIYLDSTLLGTFRPGSTSYGALATAAFTTTAGGHTLKFVGRDSAGGDNTAFIDAVQVTGVIGTGDTGTVTVSINGTPYTYNYGASDNTGTIAAGLAGAINAGSLAQATSLTNTDVPVTSSGFEAPALGSGNFQYNPVGGTWTFSGASGVSAGGSGFTSGNPSAPQGAQVAFLQNGSTSVISQVLSGFQTGVSYTVSFLAAQRATSPQSVQDFDIYLDSRLLGTFQPGSTSYGALSTTAFTTAAGSHTLQFVGRDSTGGDNTAFLDSVRVVAAGGSTVSLISNVHGSAANYTLAASGTHGAGFTLPSFIASPSGTTLTGGQDTGDLNNNPYVTQYSYDLLDNLTCMEQHGNVTGAGCTPAVMAITDNQPPAADATSPWRIRRFAYDSLGRVRWTSDPESGLTSAQYNNDGVLISATDARGITVNLNPVDSPIDALHRITKKTYSDGSTPVTYTYDVTSFGAVQSSNQVGLLVHMSNGVNASTTFAYDPMGRPVLEAICIPSNCNESANQVKASYDLAGNLNTFVYPSGRKLAYSYNAAGHFIKANFDSFGAASVNFPYYNIPTGASPSNWGYWPTGAMHTGIFGNGVQQTLGVNARQQLTAITQAKGTQTLLSKTYGLYDPSVHNNGDILSIADGLSANSNQTYSYDQLNRISSGAQADGTFNITFNYDPWGNMKQSGTSSFQPLFDVHNRIASAPANCNSIASYCYDAAGNLLNDGFHQYAYDAEGRMKAVDVTAVTYTYGAGGKRVRKDIGASATEFIDFGDQMIAEKSVATGIWTDYIMAYGARIARDSSTNASGAQYFQADQIESTRLVTDNTGTVIWQASYDPFGQELNAQNSGIRFQFAGMEYDSESNLNHTDFRQYTSVEGRWLSPDPSPGSLNPGNPQSLNRYVYVLNNPLIMDDPKGLDCIYNEKAAKDSNLPGPGILRGDCLSDTDGGVFVNGKIDIKNLISYDGKGRLGYRYQNENSDANVGTFQLAGGGGEGADEASTWADCVRDTGKFASAQNILANTFNSPGINESWVAGALLGNPWSDGIEALQNAMGGEVRRAEFNTTMSVFHRSEIAEEMLEHMGVKLEGIVVIKILNPPGPSAARRAARRAGWKRAETTAPYSTAGKVLKTVAGAAKALNLWNHAVTFQSTWMCAIGR